jgi:hypothetical protein
MAGTEALEDVGRPSDVQGSEDVSVLVGSLRPVFRFQKLWEMHGDSNRDFMGFKGILWDLLEIFFGT